MTWEEFREEYAKEGYDNKFHYTGYLIVILLILFLIALTVTIKYFFGIEIIPIRNAN